MANPATTAAPETIPVPATAEDHAAMGHGPVTAEATATTEAAHSTEEHAVPSALGFDATMLVALAMLIVIGLAIWKKVPAIIAGALDKQIAAIREQLDVATNLRKEAEAIKAEYQAQARQATRDAQAMKIAATAEAKDIIARAKEDATALITRRGKMAEEKIAAAEAAAIADVRAKAASTAIAAATSLIAQSSDSKTKASLIDAAISQLN
jgi:F-type H+-transporting ATPase subunit b